MSETTIDEATRIARTHRVYSLELKQQIVLETLQPGCSVSAVARKHGINDNIVFDRTSCLTLSTRRSAREIEAVANALNTRPRKTLGWKTPAEALDDYLKSVQQSSVATTG